MIYGYARCSTNESKQDISRQVRELKSAGAEKIYLEYEHGDSVIKDQQQMMFEEAKEGDIIELIRDKKLKLVIVGSITLDCRNGQADPMSEAFLQMAGVFSQLELAIIRQRVKSGMRNAQAKGVKIGRPQTTKEDVPASFVRHYPAYKMGNLNISELARLCNLSRGTVYKYIYLLEKQ